MQQVLRILMAALLAASISPGAFAQSALTQLGTYAADVFDGAAANVLAYDAASQRLFVTNGSANTIDVLDISDPANPTLVTAVDFSAYGTPTSVDVHGGLVAVAIKSSPATDPGTVVFMDADGWPINTVTVGAYPDMLTFTPNGSKVLVANEGEPSDDYTIDPEGSVSVIDVSSGAASATVMTAGFGAWIGREGELRDAQVRIYGPGANAAQDLEPEFIAVAPDGATAWVTLQENNAIAVIDVAAASVTSIFGLGYKNHRVPANSLDASDKDGGINLANWPVQAMYLPDGIAAFDVGGQTYYISANEGDARDYGGFSEEARVADLVLGNGLKNSFPDLQKKANLGRLKVTTSPPTGKVTTGNGKEFYNQLFCYGGRSFTIHAANGAQVYDSGNDIEEIFAAYYPEIFNSNDDDNDSFDARSDDKGPEPEAVIVAEINGSSYAFILLERVGGVMVYDVSNPSAPTFVDYCTSRDFTGDPEAGTAGDLSPEGLVFISAADSPTGQPLLAITGEVSGTTTIFSVNLP